MNTAAIIAVTIVVALVIIVFSAYIIRLLYERRFNEWRDSEVEKWQADIDLARKDAVARSRASLGGRFTEQMVPFFPDFAYDPTEVRFIGSPIDMVVFPGLAQGDPREIVILEIKTGRNAQLNQVQRKIRQLIEDGMVRWDEVHQKGEELNSPEPPL